MTDLKSSVPLLVCAFLAAGTTGGTSYAFGIYGEALKEELLLTQSQLDTISSASFTAGILSWIPGLFVDKCGEKCSMVGGGFLGASALLGFWVVAREFVIVPRDYLVPILSAFGVLIFVACALVTGSVFKIIVANTKSVHKGSAVGAAKGFVGLGSGAYAVLFEALDRKSDLDFLPMAAFFFLAAATLPALCLLPGKREETARVDLSTSAHYSSLYMGLIAMAVLVVGQSVVELISPAEGELNDQREGPDYIMAAVVPFVWFGPILGLLILPAATHTVLPTDIQDDDDEAPLTDALAKVVQAPFKDEPASREECEYGEVQDISVSEQSSVVAPSGDRSLVQMLGTPSAWLILWTCTILVGGGTVMTNNLGQMTEALRFDPKVVPAALSLFSVAQSFARVVTGSLSSLVKRRTSFFIYASFAGLAAHSVLAIATDEMSFIGGVFLSGLAFGMVWPLMVLVTGDLFGTENVGANYMFYDGLTSALGTLALSKFVAQRVYEDNIVDGGDGVTCYGPECFQMTNWIIAGLSVTCILTSLCLQCMPLTRQTYG
mmetsp:Transcript_9551/g.15908  ORF Transcript_9551/g.15908 Transcript_9551/m.15908 type:complete len:548 (+) Transcript_9551:46-1689(+)|eukprot:CAMPEP_0119006948 /NCGR_PEP_ID=MMETSP1176-20130426/2655_1 /TAXON_ID=265551 /ORGANISM="Synedropsis recta cf, Strain CCMP1620" /LENGTH=547 /DNA_ID=CAMNT_0006958985 /DNA_START=47 /DNA_END=1690 /DNA_ORIENTATION=-